MTDIGDLGVGDKLKPKEVKFLNNYLLQGLSLESAVKSAGYKANSKKAREITGSRIIEKYCALQGDHKKIFRQIGLNEVQIAQTIQEIALNPKLGTGFRLKALDLAARCLGLTKDVIEGLGGFQVIFEGSQAPAPVPGAAPAPGVAPSPAPALPPGPLSIVK